MTARGGWTATIWGRPIAESLGGRDNNLNLVRIAAATAVLVSHSVAITTGNPALEPLRGLTGLSLGDYSVGLFFGISGLLIARSFDRRTSLAHFAVARFLRLWPALFVVLAIGAFVLGPVMTALPVDQYLRRPSTWLYVPRGLSLYFQADQLPGVFMANPMPESVNGSLWSLFYEVTCYAGVVALGLAGLLRRRALFAVFMLAVLAGHVLSVFSHPAGGLAYRLDLLGFVGFPFALGMAAYVWRDQIRLGPGGVALCWLAVALSAGSPMLGTVTIVAVVYSALWFGYVPKGALLAYNRLGDYSYGVYIFAFPTQQTLVALLPGQTAPANIALTVPVVMVLAFLSWNLIEKRALAMARPAGDRLACALAGKPAPGHAAN